MNKHSESDLLAKALGKARANHNLPHAEDDEIYLQCPLCGGSAPESDFDEVEDPDTDEESDSEGADDDDADGKYRTDPLTTSSQNDDDVQDGDGAKVPKWDNRRVDRLNALAQSLAAAASKTAKR